ncbi:YdbH domain-containing protein [uncultured Pseudodesulfovibrio sp.]|uniref:intermembrane phospholipid transport protein YdbH family protein n=1 Tax=uncultured Pseudodesulfovibrio sp. TaxID=2035858 RepID=UPI0029C85A1F|nr:YdbH domain-containing protein [uncultured Pseudodesulfovibrio sp.]
MSDTVRRRVLKWIILLTPWVLSLCLAVGWAISVWTPQYLERLVPNLADELGVPLEEFHIRDAGLFSADIGPVRIGSEEDGLRVNNVQVSYSPASLKAERVDSITVSGLEIDAEYDGKSFVLPLLDLLPKGEDDAAGSGGLPDLPFGTLVIEDSFLFFDYLGTRLVLPFSATVTPGRGLSFAGDVRLRDQLLTFSGALGPAGKKLAVELETHDFRLGSLADLLPVSVRGGLNLSGTVNADLDAPEDVQAAFTLSVDHPGCPDSGIRFAPETVLAVNGTVAERGVALSFAPVSLAAPHPVTIQLPEVRLSQEAVHAAFSVAAMGIEMPGEFSAKLADGKWAFELAADNSVSQRLETDGRAIGLGGLSLSAKGTATNDGADMVVQASTGRINLDGTGLRTGRVKLSLPLKWPAPEKNTTGNLSVSSLRHGKMRLGSVHAKLRQEGTNVGFGGVFATELLPGLRVSFSGSSSMTGREATLKFKVPRYALPEGFDASKLHVSLKDIAFTGNLNIEGGVDVSQDGIDSRLGVFLTGGSASFGEGGMKIDGIRIYFESPDIIDFHSSPAQVFAFDSFTAEGIRVENGLVTFQLEPRGVVLVERGRFKWCDGFVESRAFRVVPGLDEYDVTLFCTNLKLTQLLHQLGLAKAKGDSALSGELPVTWKRGQISFNDGFLHSTPGQGGVIQVEAMEDLVQSIPKGTPQRGQLELARAAIKDFEYKWVRIKADTVGRDLLVRLSLDGKPVSTLPFVYRKEFGGFAMVEGDVKGSNFQGLRLDVNFSLPLDRILLYKNLIKRIE